MACGVYSANGRLLTLSPGKRRGTFYCHFQKIMASTQNQGPQYPAKGGARISGDPTASATAQGADLATCDPTQSVSTQGTLGRLATCDLSGRAGRSSSTTSPARGTTSQLTSSNWWQGKTALQKTPCWWCCSTWCSRNQWCAGGRSWWGSWGWRRGYCQPNHSLGLGETHGRIIFWPGGLRGRGCAYCVHLAGGDGQNLSPPRYHWA